MGEGFPGPPPYPLVPDVAERVRRAGPGARITGFTTPVGLVGLVTRALTDAHHAASA